ncbi:MAG: ATP-binding protein [Candidatus Cybelea sp.]
MVAIFSKASSGHLLARGTTSPVRYELRVDRRRGGTGLGLAIARTIVEANRGKMELSNGAEGGAIVTIELAAVTN